MPRGKCSGRHAERTRRGSYIEWSSIILDKGEAQDEIQTASVGGTVDWHLFSRSRYQNSIRVLGASSQPLRQAVHTGVEGHSETCLKIQGPGGLRADVSSTNHSSSRASLACSKSGKEQGPGLGPTSMTQVPEMHDMLQLLPNLEIRKCRFRERHVRARGAGEAASVSKWDRAGTLLSISAKERQ